MAKTAEIISGMLGEARAALSLPEERAFDGVVRSSDPLASSLACCCFALAVMLLTSLAGSLAVRHGQRAEAGRACASAVRAGRAAGGATRARVGRHGRLAGHRLRRRYIRLTLPCRCLPSRCLLLLAVQKGDSSPGRGLPSCVF
jgi:hypothetical protein